VSGYQGLLCIGDPHLEARQPGFRKDDYAAAILGKLEWILEWAREESLLPAFLGDVFDKPRDNPTWLLSRLVDLLKGRETIGIYGNHDCADPILSDNDSLMLLFKTGLIRLVSADAPWSGQMNGAAVTIGGSSYREPLPKQAPSDGGICIWLSHHDLILPGYEEGRLRTGEIPGVSLVVNGHIHRELETRTTGETVWMTPGNISRRSRSDAVRDHVPSVLRVIPGTPCVTKRVTVPHRPFEEVFHPLLTEEQPETGASAFVAGLAELESRRTESGAGLLAFIEKNMDQFDVEVAAVIRELAGEVTGDDNRWGGDE
jgi:DNA repair exonuclease SbcCD nuclease subunit